MKRVIWLVLDGVGAGEAPDAKSFGDVGSNTIGNLARVTLANRGTPLHLPHLMSLGLGNVNRGVDVGAYPLAKGFTFGVNLSY